MLIKYRFLLVFIRVQKISTKIRPQPFCVKYEYTLLFETFCNEEQIKEIYSPVSLVTRYCTFYVLNDTNNKKKIRVMKIQDKRKSGGKCRNISNGDKKDLWFF